MQLKYIRALARVRIQINNAALVRLACRPVRPVGPPSAFELFCLLFLCSIAIFSSSLLSQSSLNS